MMTINRFSAVLFASKAKANKKQLIACSQDFNTVRSESQRQENKSSADVRHVTTHR